jgi:membrane protein YdbS with pleckstrin-like domain
VKIENNTQLTYYEHLLENLAVKEVSQTYALDNILTIMALLISIGAMIATFGQVNGSNFSLVQTAVIIVLSGVIGYAIYAQYTLIKNKKELPLMVKTVENAIECYKKGKEND